MRPSISHNSSSMIEVTAVVSSANRMKLRRIEARIESASIPSTRVPQRRWPVFMGSTVSITHPSSPRLAIIVRGSPVATRADNSPETQGGRAFSQLRATTVPTGSRIVIERSRGSCSMNMVT